MRLSERVENATFRYVLPPGDPPLANLDMKPLNTLDDWYQIERWAILSFSLSQNCFFSEKSKCFKLRPQRLIYLIYRKESDKVRLRALSLQLILDLLLAGNRPLQCWLIVFRTLPGPDTLLNIAKGTLDPRHWVLWLIQNLLFKPRASTSFEILVKLQLVWQRARK